MRDGDAAAILPGRADGTQGVTCGVLDTPFYFLRHGQSTANADAIIGGSMDVPLTATGRSEAQRAADLLADAGLATILSSPQQRARDTAQTVADRAGLAIEIVDGLQERHWGHLEGRPIAARGSVFDTPEGGESWPDFIARVWSALTGARVRPPALIVAHNGTMRVLRHQLGIGQMDSPVGNALPMLFTPPRGPGRDWTLSPLVASSAP